MTCRVVVDCNHKINDSIYLGYIGLAKIISSISQSSQHRSTSSAYIDRRLKKKKSHTNYDSN